MLYYTTIFPFLITLLYALHSLLFDVSSILLFHDFSNIDP